MAVNEDKAGGAGNGERLVLEMDNSVRIRVNESKKTKRMLRDALDACGWTEEVRRCCKRTEKERERERRIIIIITTSLSPLISSVVFCIREEEEVSTGERTKQSLSLRSIISLGDSSRENATK